jgi:hypothetical protein
MVRFTPIAATHRKLGYQTEKVNHLPHPSPSVLCMMTMTLQKVAPNIFAPIFNTDGRQQLESKGFFTQTSRLMLCIIQLPELRIFVEK